MQLGALIRRLEDETDAAQAMDALGDIVLFTRVKAMGQLHDETPGAYLAGASRRFTNLGSDEDWLALMTAIERADNPARAVIGKVLNWALDQDREPASAKKCGCGGGTEMCHDHG